MNNFTGQDIAAKAREWKGTKYRHQGFTRNGADCMGFVRGVLVEMEYEPVKTWIPARYSRDIPPTVLRDGCDAVLSRVSDYRIGDVVLLRIEEQNKHLGFIVDGADGGLNLLHLDSKKGCHEVTFDEYWKKTIAGIYRCNHLV